MIIKKRHFQLLEVMVAIFLIVICAIPVLNAYISMSQAQFESSRSNQRDHLVHLVHGKIVEELYRNRIPWQDIEVSKQEELEKLNNIEDLVKQFKKFNYNCFYQIIRERPKELKNNSKNFLFKLVITVQDLKSKQLVPIVYNYVIYAKHE